jgi:hypothetical protein
MNMDQDEKKAQRMAAYQARHDAELAVAQAKHKRDSHLTGNDNTVSYKDGSWVEHDELELAVADAELAKAQAEREVCLVHLAQAKAQAEQKET